VAEERPPRWGLIKASYQAAWICFLDLRIATAVAILVQFGTEFFVCFGHDPGSSRDTIAGLMCEAIRAIALSPYAILIHRWIILQDESRDYFATALAPRALRFIGVSLLFVLAQVIVDGLSALERFSGWFFLLTLITAVTSLVAVIRLSLVFPIIAVDGSKMPFADSFRITRGSAWWIGWTFLLASAPLIFVAIGFYFAQPRLSGGLAAVPMAAEAVWSAFAYAVTVALASYLYRTRADWARPVAAAGG